MKSTREGRGGSGGVGLLVREEVLFERFTVDCMVGSMIRLERGSNGEVKVGNNREVDGKRM